MDKAQALKDQARSLEHSGQDQAALDLYSRLATDAAEPDPAVLVRIGNLQLRLGRPVEAASSFARSAALLEEAGLRNGALALFHRVARLDPSFAPALLRLGELSAREGYLEDAGVWLERFCERTEQAGEPEAGWNAVRSYLTSFPGDAGMRRLLVERLEAHGRTDEARALATQGPRPEPAEENPPPGSAPASPADAAGRGESDDFLAVLGSSWERDDAGDARVETDADLGILPTRLDDPEAEPDVAPLAGLEPTLLEGLEPTRLEGLEPTTAEPHWSREEPESPSEGADWTGSAGDLDLPLLGPNSFDAEGSPAPRPDDAAAEPPGEEDPVQRLLIRVAAEPGDLDLRHELIALLQGRGETELLAPALDAAHPAFAAAGRYAEATDLVSELIDLRPDAVELLAQRVEYALASGDDARSVAALLALGRRLDARADPGRARQVFSRVLKLDPGNAEAARAVAALEPTEPDFLDPAPPPPADGPRGSTRAQVSVDHPSGDDDRDFAEILDLFRRQVSEQIDPADAASHYDLGLAFKEMGLLDDAIQQLQIALLGGARPVPTLEVLGECLFDKGQHSLAARVFGRAIRIAPAPDAELVGVRYWLGRCEEELGNPAAARDEYQRVVAVDPGFRDAAARLEGLSS